MADTFVDGGHDPRYDTKIHTTQPSRMSWLVGGPPMDQAETRDERYAGFVISLSKVLADWQASRLTSSEALQHADFYMEKIIEIGSVNGESARSILEERGIDDAKRLELQKSFQDLKKACGQSVPQFNARRQRNPCC
mmetsp:Transcript_16075/g.48426  ORF Transcript_16075/g.48426 Transcript_16075/m.48426 type:complete len:137 (+) Transcript_16075:87-497(+)